MIIVVLIHPKFIRHIGPFNSLYKAYCYAEEIVNNIEKRYKVHELRFITPADSWWEADFDPLRYDRFIPATIQVKDITAPNEFATWYAPKLWVYFLNFPVII